MLRNPFSALSELKEYEAFEKKRKARESKPRDIEKENTPDDDGGMSDETIMLLQGIAVVLIILFYLINASWINSSIGWIYDQILWLKSFMSE